MAKQDKQESFARSRPAGGLANGALKARARLDPVRAGRRWGVRIELGNLVLEQVRPVRVALASGRVSGVSTGYEVVDWLADGLTGNVTVRLDARTSLDVTDHWHVSGAEVTVSRDVIVRGNEEDGFMTSIGLSRNIPTSWSEIMPFAPGAVYGNCEPVPKYAIASPTLRRRAPRYALCREDRLAAPVFSVRYADGEWLAVMHKDAEAANTIADSGEVAGGETLIDPRLSFASLGCAARRDRLEIGAWFPGTEGEVTYSSGQLPLLQRRAWRRRFHPLGEGTTHRYQLVYRAGASASSQDFYPAVWRWAWDKLAPRPEPVDPDVVVRVSTSVLARQAVTTGPLAGIPLEVDAVTGRPAPASPAIMGFVGANTDAAYVLLRVGTRIGGKTGEHYRTIGTRILDSFATIGLTPPQGEGFDLVTGNMTSYRHVARRPAVFTRSIADGCAGALKAWQLEIHSGFEHPAWLRWAEQGADWLVSVQGSGGSFPRAFEAGTGAVIDSSTNASQVPIAFLASLARATGKPTYLDAALRAGDYCWQSGGEMGCFAGATLDNPDVVDKEAAITALEGFLELYESTGDVLWIERARFAAEMAETWIYIWNVPMPVDADNQSLHWKRGVSTVGQQLIATGVSMCDGFLAKNAAAFAALSRLTGDAHFIDVARVVTQGTKAMLALPGRTYDLHGEGWQQEHWCFAVHRGYGLNRNWLPWVSVANVEGILRLEDLGEIVTGRVLGPES